ncbi:MAG: hypothetical protein H6710_20360 [Myxococcales bacterium]|nr:hypothetical protein [Myxococcales bacterium]MCB9706297.1 hypothetical protein [Myxococcales bacterium]
MSSELERLVVDLASLVRSRHYGKFRGVVTDIDDPQGRGFIRAQVPEIYGEGDSPWAIPSVPFAGSDHGLVALPEVGDGVWIEFEGGDPARPIWSGAWWADGEMPSQGGTRKRAFVTSAGHRLVLDDEAGEIRLEHGDGPKIVIGSSTITIEVGAKKIEVSNSRVSVNNGNLEVT